MVGFGLVREGYNQLDWEDYFGYTTQSASGGSARCVVLDGAAEAFDAQRWVRQLADGFLALREPHLENLESTAMLEWISRMQQRWLDDGGSDGLSVFEEIKLRDQGSLATFLGCQIDGLN